MAKVYMTASAAVAAVNNKGTNATKIFVTGDQAVATIGTIELKQGGSGGTTVWKCYMDGGSSGQFTIPNIIFDYVTIANVEILLEYQRGKYNKTP